MRIIGIDPGLEGGIATFEDGILTEAVSMPTLEKKTMNWAEIQTIMQDANFIVLEEQFIKPVGGRAQRGMAKTMRNFGNLEGILRGVGTSHQVVKAQLWKKQVLAGTARDKVAAIQYCQAKYPTQSLLASPRCRNPLTASLMQSASPSMPSF